MGSRIRLEEVVFTGKKQGLLERSNTHVWEAGLTWLSYNFLTSYGGRGWSLIDASTMDRVYDSGDIMESFFLSDAVTDSQEAVYNSYYYSTNTAQSQYKDRTSINWGPNPSAIATGNINGTQVVVVANGNVGGLYTFSISINGTTPQVSFENFVRRGSPGLTWTDAYKRSDDAVGEPGIEDLLNRFILHEVVARKEPQAGLGFICRWIEDEGEHVVVAISRIAGVASFYSAEIQP
ncbi:mesenchyme-specific cell surface glycoprotein [Plakobranchus ocellatus]|uniref:Mesenchyme-specific cell surface glycoprotein n=1 Tax=Plakobranchus ocellatus TaxID=259542 RepID=A0AAV4DA67_9GAST|nr:mesenchyme-specific cell surface glycoprotein [Plakobranchus ocellatus]